MTDPTPETTLLVRVSSAPDCASVVNPTRPLLPTAEPTRVHPPAWVWGPDLRERLLLMVEVGLLCAAGWCISLGLSWFNDRQRPLERAIVAEPQGEPHPTTNVPAPVPAAAATVVHAIPVAESSAPTPAENLSPLVRRD